MWILLGGLTTLVSGLLWGREAAFLLGPVGILLVGLIGRELAYPAALDDPIQFFPEVEEELTRRNKRKALRRTLRWGLGVLLALILLAAPCWLIA